jgi:hypothetical protein
MKSNLVCLAFVTSLVVASGALADTVNSVSCFTPGAALITGATSCSAAFYGYANASSTSSVILPSYVGQALDIQTSASASALLGSARGISAFSTAQSSTNLAISLDTTGPVRNGYLELNFLQTSWTAPAFGSINELLTIGTYSVNPNGQTFSVFIPVELGTSFNLTYLNNLIVNGDAATSSATGSIGSDISLLAFESDRSTAVGLFDPPAAVATPEPGSLGMMAVAVLLAATLLCKTRR